MTRKIYMVCAAILVCVALPAFAQQGTGALRGRVMDQSQAVLPGVNIIARNEASGMFREIISGEDGSFFMSAMTPGVYQIEAQLPGFKKYQRTGVRIEVGKTQDIDVQLAGDVLTITGEKKEEHEEKKANYCRCERSWGAFERTLALPCEVDPEKVSAIFKKGVLHVNLPKTATAQRNARKVTVRAS